MTKLPEKPVDKGIVASKVDLEKPDRAVPVKEPDEDLVSQGLSLTLSELTQSSFEFTGPLPPPSMLKAYEDSHPGCAERILRMAEEEQKNLHSLQQKSFDQPHQYAILTNINGAIVAIVGITSSAYVTVNGFPWAGAALFSATLAGIVVAFIKSRRGGDEKQEVPHSPPPKPRRKR